MFKEFLGKKVKITMKEGDSETEHYNMQIVEINNTLLKVHDANNNVKIINTDSSSFVKLELQN